MKINRIQKVEFAKIKTGEVFKTHNGLICMKTNRLEIEDSGFVLANAVNLENGAFKLFNDMELVYPVTAEATEV